MESDTAKKLEEYTNNLDNVINRRKIKRNLINSKGGEESNYGKDLTKSHSESALNLAAAKRYQRQLQELAKVKANAAAAPSQTTAPTPTPSPAAYSPAILSRSNSQSQFPPIFRSPSSMSLMGSKVSVNSTSSNRSAGTRLNKINQQSSKFQLDQKIVNEALRIQNMGTRAVTAARANKIFVMNDDLPVLREALVQRGWVQKYSAEQLAHRIRSPYYNEMRHIAYILKYYRPNFVWTYTNYNKFEFHTAPIYSRLIGRSIDGDFTLKSGLSNLYNNMHWFYLSEDSPFIFPRSYSMSNKHEILAFVQDFRVTYCTGFLYHLSKLENLHELFSSYGNVTSECIHFALEQVSAAIAQKSHLDIDRNVDISKNVHQYLRYNKVFQGILRYGLKIRIVENITVDELIADIRRVVHETLTYFPDVQYDGYHNIWIVKPSSSQCGCGIKVFNTEKEIINYITASPTVTYVVQKYIERPLLVYNTKFDIRQHFLITMDGKYFNVWMYRNCYCRFSSQEFTLEDLEESIHLTNHAIQKNYTNGIRSEELPSHNMWIKKELLNYFNIIKQPDVWEETIYPRMVEALKTVVNASLDEIEYATNNFQLFGADFMITEDFQPILIEINSAPSLIHSTVSSKVVNTAVLQDLVKVVIDRVADENASTGDFENIFKLEMPKVPTNLECIVTGHALRLPYKTGRLAEEVRKGPVEYNNYIFQEFKLISNRNLPLDKSKLPSINKRPARIQSRSSGYAQTPKANLSQKSKNSIMTNNSFITFMHDRAEKAEKRNAAAGTKTKAQLKPISTALNNTVKKRIIPIQAKSQSARGGGQTYKRPVRGPVYVAIPTNGPSTSKNSSRSSGSQKVSPKKISAQGNGQPQFSFLNRQSMLNKLTSDEIKATNAKLIMIKKRIEQYTSEINMNDNNNQMAKRKDSASKRPATTPGHASSSKYIDVYNKNYNSKEKIRKS